MQPGAPAVSKSCPIVLRPGEGLRVATAATVRRSRRPAMGADTVSRRFPTIRGLAAGRRRVAGLPPLPRECGRQHPGTGAGFSAPAVSDLWSPEVRADQQAADVASDPRLSRRLVGHDDDRGCDQEISQFVLGHASTRVVPRRRLTLAGRNVGDRACGCRSVEHVRRGEAQRVHRGRLPHLRATARPMAACARNQRTVAWMQAESGAAQRRFRRRRRLAGAGAPPIARLPGLCVPGARRATARARNCERISRRQSARISPCRGRPGE